MKNINAYNDDSFDFHQKVVKSKYKTKLDETYKERLEKLDPILQPLFENHTNKFSVNKLEELTGHGFTGQNKDDLEKLYSYSSTPIKNLKISLTTVDDNIEDVTCPFCTISRINTMDHNLPISEFPEFSVNPKNLFPMCSECNSAKSIIQGTVVKPFLNLYTDILPSVEYLFVTIDKDLKPHFVVDNRNSIDRSLFQTIASHYSRLDLCRKFQQNSYPVTSKLHTTVKSYLRTNDLNSIINNTIEIANEIRKNSGTNFWQSVLEIALIQDKGFLEFCQNH